VGWYGSAYLLTSTALQPTYGKMYQSFSLKWLFVIVVLLFEIGSLICGVAPNSTTFIVGRAIAGLGAGNDILNGVLTFM
jgi:MFS family permease